MNGDSIAQGVTTGVAGAMVFWSLAFLRDQLKNLLLNRAIKRQLSFVACGTGISGLSATIRNHLQKSFTVREVTLVTTDSEYVMVPTDDVESSTPFHTTKTEAAALKLGRGIRAKTGFWQVPLQIDGFAEVQSFTSRTYLLPLRLLSQLKGVARYLHITVEYQSWTGKTRLITVTTRGWASERIEKAITAMKTEFSNGVAGSSPNTDLGGCAPNVLQLKMAAHSLSADTLGY